MQRRGSVRVGTLLVAIVLTLLAIPLGTAGVSAGTSHPSEAPIAPALIASPPAPPDTVTEFYPESANLSDCVGLVEKPGCGSDSRGGWRQTAVFVVLFAGLGIILWRISRGIKANREVVDAEVEPPASRG